METVLYNLTEAITIGASLLESFMPDTSAKIPWSSFNTEKRSLEQMDQFGLYPSGNHVTDKPEILFARMDMKEVMEKVEAMQAASAAGTAQEGAGEEAGAPEVIDIEAKPEISYDDFAKLQFQVGEIILARQWRSLKSCSVPRFVSEVR